MAATSVTSGKCDECVWWEVNGNGQRIEPRACMEQVRLYSLASIVSYNFNRIRGESKQD